MVAPRTVTADSPSAASTVGTVSADAASVPSACRTTRYAVAAKPVIAAITGDGSERASAPATATTATVAASRITRPTISAPTATAARTSAGPVLVRVPAATIRRPKARDSGSVTSPPRRGALAAPRHQAHHLVEG